MTTNTNTRDEIELKDDKLGIEELELVSGGWFVPAQAYAALAAASGPSQYETLPAGWASGIATCPYIPD